MACVSATSTSASIYTTDRPTDRPIVSANALAPAAHLPAEHDKERATRRPLHLPPPLTAAAAAAGDERSGTAVGGAAIVVVDASAASRCAAGNSVAAIVARTSAA